MTTTLPLTETFDKTCSACGQEHRTWPLFLVGGEQVGVPCLPEPRRTLTAANEAMAEQGCLTVRELLRDQYESTVEFVLWLDRHHETLTEKEAEYVRLFRLHHAEKGKECLFHEAAAEAIFRADEMVEKEPEGTWLGVEKERVTTRVRVTRIVGPYPSDYGDQYLCVMETLDTKDAVIWWTGDNLYFEEGVEYNIRGTVKKLDVRDGKKQTVLTRVKEEK